jgi:hypothetical protein
MRDFVPPSASSQSVPRPSTLGAWLALGLASFLALGALVPYATYGDEYEVSRATAMAIGIGVALVLYLVAVPFALAFRRWGFWKTVAGLVFLTVLLPLGLVILFHTWWLLLLLALKPERDDPGWAGWKTMVLYDVMQRSGNGR